MSEGTNEESDFVKELFPTAVGPINRIAGGLSGARGSDMATLFAQRKATDELIKYKIGDKSKELSRVTVLVAVRG